MQVGVVTPYRIHPLMKYLGICESHHVILSITIVRIVNY